MAQGRSSDDRTGPIHVEYDIDGRPIVMPGKDSGMYSHRAEVQLRSTTDPLEINFATVSLADRLQSKYVGRKQRTWAWIGLVIPAAMFSVVATMVLWQPSPGRTIGQLSMGEYLFRYVATAFVWGAPVFWIYIMYRRRRET